MKNKLIDRWIDDELFQFIYAGALLDEIEPESMTWKEWFEQKAPLIPDYLRGDKKLDCRFVRLDGLRIGENEICHILDDGSAKLCFFIHTQFQGGTAARVNFTRSRFVWAQMHPFYATGANFSYCTFLSSFLGGYGVKNFDSEVESDVGALNDFTNCMFVEVVADKSYFERCDFKGSNFSNSYFESCHFYESDMRDVKLTCCEFRKCDFRDCWITDSPENREVISKGQNINIETIQWK